MNELKPCPFCGNPAVLNFSTNGNLRFYDEYGQLQHTELTYYMVECSDCLVRTRDYRQPKYAIEAWNMRVSNG